MTFGLIFWIIMLLWLIYGLWDWRTPGQLPGWGNSVWLFILFLLLGWHVFGAPVRP